MIRGVVKDKVILITGANSGIGRAITEGVARSGATAVMACRSRKRGAKALSEIRRDTGNDDVHLLIADLSIQAQVRALATEFKDRFDRLDVLVNNAGLMASRRKLTPDGIEMVFAVNHLAYFLLTHLLIDVLKTSAPSRIVNISSSGHSSGTIDFDNLQGEKRFRPWEAYPNSKLANVMFTYELARRLEGTGVTANCCHPGVIHTNLLRQASRPLNLLWRLLGPFFKQPEEGAEMPLHLILSPEVDGVTGRYFRRMAPMDTTAESNDRDKQKRLWDISLALTGLEETV